MLSLHQRWLVEPLQLCLHTRVLTYSRRVLLADAKSLPGISAPFPQLFDPANLLGNAAGTANGINEVKRWRESEITHGRVAMLATLGFITQEQILGSSAPRLFPHVEGRPGLDVSNLWHSLSVLISMPVCCTVASGLCLAFTLTSNAACGCCCATVVVRHHFMAMLFLTASQLAHSWTSMRYTVAYTTLLFDRMLLAACTVPTQAFGS